MSRTIIIRSTKKKSESDPLNETIQAILDDVDSHYESFSNHNQSRQLVSDSELQSSNGEKGENNCTTIQLTNTINNTIKKRGSKSNDDSGTHIVLSKKSLKNTIRLLRDGQRTNKRERKPRRKHSDADVASAKVKHKFRRTCQEGFDNMLDLINWDSYAYVVRAIRHLILHREWEYLSEMLLLLMKQPRIFKNYVKEMTYLYFLINGDTINSMHVDEYFQLCFSATPQTEFREFDIWYKHA